MRFHGLHISLTLSLVFPKWFREFFSHDLGAALADLGGGVNEIKVIHLQRLLLGPYQRGTSESEQSLLGSYHTDVQHYSHWLPHHGGQKPTRRLMFISDAP